DHAVHHPLCVAPRSVRLLRCYAASLTLSPTRRARRSSMSTRITTQEGSNSKRLMLNLGLEGYAWWLLCRLSPPVSHASTRRFVAELLPKFLRPHQWPRPLMDGASTKT